MHGNTKLRVGEWVEVRSKEEILRTLDKYGQLEDCLHAEMFAYCGKRSVYTSGLTKHVTRSRLQAAA